MTAATNGVRFDDLEPEATDASPWGPIQYAHNLAEGIVFVSTASHGGFWLSQERRDAVPALWRRYAAHWAHGWGDQWYEEDCARSAVILTFPDVFDDDAGAIAAARATMIYLMKSGALTSKLTAAAGNARFGVTPN